MRILFDDICFGAHSSLAAVALDGKLSAFGKKGALNWCEKQMVTTQLITLYVNQALFGFAISQTRSIDSRPITIR